MAVLCLGCGLTNCGLCAEHQLWMGCWWYQLCLGCEFANCGWGVVVPIVDWVVKAVHCRWREGLYHKILAHGRCAAY